MVSKEITVGNFLLPGATTEIKGFIKDLIE